MNFKELLRFLDEIKVLTDKEAKVLEKAFKVDIKKLEKMGVLIRVRLLGEWLWVVNHKKLEELLR